MGFRSPVILRCPGQEEDLPSSREAVGEVASRQRWNARTRELDQHHIATAVKHPLQ